jgi:hypothetical protein
MPMENPVLLVAEQLRVIWVARRGRHKRSEVINQSCSQETNEPSSLEKAEPGGVLEFDCISSDKETRLIIY